ncbi:hypothetical protein HKW97_24160 (plasmid) [Pseudomonas luteola]
MMGQLPEGQQRLFSSFNLEDHVPARHLLRSIDQCLDLNELPPRSLTEQFCRRNGKQLLFQQNWPEAVIQRFTQAGPS